MLLRPQSQLSHQDLQLVKVPATSEAAGPQGPKPGFRGRDLRARARRRHDVSPQGAPSDMPGCRQCTRGPQSFGGEHSSGTLEASSLKEEAGPMTMKVLPTGRVNGPVGREPWEGLAPALGAHVPPTLRN